MKIGIDIRAIGKERTGDETYTKNLIINLLKIDQTNQYFFYTNTKNKEQIEEIRREIDSANKYKNFEIVSIVPNNKFFWTFYSLPKYLKNNPVDILHVQYITPQFFLPKLKLITTIHDVSFERYPQFIKKLDLFFLKILIPLSLKKANAIIAVSQFTKEELVRYYSNIRKNKITVIYNGAATSSFKKGDISQKLPLKVRNKYDLPEKYLLYAGTLQPRKNIPFLIKSFEELKIRYSKNPMINGLKLVLTGNKKAHHFDGKINTALEEIRDKKILADIRFIGHVDDQDLFMVYKQAQIFCFCSLYEGFGLPLVEAMRSQLPVICSESSCHKEIASDAACYYKENDLNDFTNKLFAIIISTNKQKSLIERGRLRVSFFSWKRCAEETLKLYNNLNNK